MDIIKGGKELFKTAKAVIIEENIYRYNFGGALHFEVKEYMESIGFELVALLDEKKYYIKNRDGEMAPHHEIDTLYIRKELIKE